MTDETLTFAAIRTDSECVGFELEEKKYCPVVDRRIQEPRRAKNAFEDGDAGDGADGDNE